MEIKRIFTLTAPIFMLMCASLVYADSHEIKAAEEMMKEAGDAAVSAVKKVATAASNVGAALPNAKAGECYAKVIIPAVYKTKTQTVTTKEASSKINIIPAKYKWVEEKVLVKEASKKLIPVPATYKKVSEKILVTPAEKVWTTGAAKKSGRVNASILAGAVANGLNLGNAKIGNCYAEYYIPAQYKTETQQVLKSEASQKIEIIPAKYSWVEESILVKDASSKLIVIPAVFETVTEQVLVKPATTEWKKGRGPVERIDGSTGEIMCLIEIPAVYKAVSKRVLKSPASTNKMEIPAGYKVHKVRKLVTPAREKKIEIPATYETVTKRHKIADEKVIWAIRGSKTDGKATGVTMCLKEIPAVYRTVQQKKVQTAAITKVVEVPAEYKVIKRRKLVSSAIEETIEIPAETQVVSRKVKVTEESMQWRAVLCETNMNGTLIANIQRALKKSGHNPGSIDGVIGRATMVAVDAFQRANGLPRGGLTLRTLEKLGIRI